MKRSLHDLLDFVITDLPRATRSRLIQQTFDALGSVSVALFRDCHASLRQPQNIGPAVSRKTE